MMRTLWTVLCLLLLTHALAAGAAVAWLFQSGRVSRDRIERAVHIFTTTIEDEEAERLRMREQLIEEVKMDEEQRWLARVARGPETVQDRLQEDREAQELRLQRDLRRQREIADMIRNQEHYKLLYTKLQKDLESESKALEAKLNAERQRRESEGFKQAVAMYEQARPKQAKAMIEQLVTSGQMDQVVDYLAAIQPRKAAAILAEFKEEQDITTATMLIEKLRTRGVEMLGEHGPLAGATP